MVRYSLAILFCLASLAAAQQPKTKRSPVTDTYHGVKVTNDYRWLEDWNRVEVKAWSDQQNRYARSILNGLPQVDPIRKRVTEILSAKTSSIGSVVYRGGKFFVLLHQPPLQQPYILVTESLDRRDGTIVVDP